MYDRTIKTHPGAFTALGLFFLYRCLLGLLATLCMYNLGAGLLVKFRGWTFLLLIIRKLHYQIVLCRAQHQKNICRFLLASFGESGNDNVLPLDLSNANLLHGYSTQNARILDCTLLLSWLPPAALCSVGFPIWILTFYPVTLLSI